MNPSPCLPIAAADGVGIELVVWLVAAAFWIVGQVSSARRKKERLRQQKSPKGDDLPSGAGQSPAPDELADIFRRLGAEIPATPPPPPSPTVVAPSPPAPPRPVAFRRKQKPAAKVSPEIAQRLARAKRDAEEADPVALKRDA